MTSLAELIGRYRDNTLELSGLLEAVTARGALPEAEQRAELAWLQELAGRDGIDRDTVRRLTEHLRTLPLRPPREDSDDATRVRASAGDPATQSSAVADAVAPHVPGEPPSGGDATIVKPFPVRPANTEEVRGADEGTGTGSSASGSNQSSWRRIARAEGGDRPGVGRLLKGRFLLEREIGRGGMGVVFLARDERKVEARDRDPYVAVKVLNDEFRHHPDSLIALQRESRRAQQLAQDNIVRVYDFDKDGTIVFMTMEYIDGSDLRALIRQRAQHGLTFAQAWPLIEGMARALQGAHAVGIVHSDFKPGNVMVTRAGVPKVFDFGIARASKLVGDAAGEQTVFDAGTLGAMTPAYASLEMLQGREPSPADDVYALGCVVFELLTGRHPFDKASAETAMKEGRRPPPVPGLDKRQYRTLCESIAFDGDKRLQSVAQLVEGLRRRSLRERLGPYALGAAAIVAVAGGGAWALSGHLHQQRTAQVLERFGDAASDRFQSEEQARQALNDLDEDERRKLILDRGETIESFLLGRLDRYWNPAQGRENYAGAQRIFALRDELKLFSPRLDARSGDIERERDDLLNTLDTGLNRAIAAGAIFEDQPGNAVAILDRIRAIVPGSALLKNPELELKYDIAIGQSLDGGDIEQAGRRIALARRLFPASERLRQRRIQLATLTTAHAGSQDSPALAALAPDEELVKAEIVSRIESLRRATAAHDIVKAKESLARIGELQPGHPFIAGEGAQLLAEAYLGRARAVCRNGRWRDAIQVIAQGLATVGEHAEMSKARERYEFALALMEARRSPPLAAPEVEQLRRRLARLRNVDPDGMKQLESDMSAKGGLPQGALDGLLASMERQGQANPPVAAGDGAASRAGNSVEAAGAARRQGPDPCAARALIGSGRECFDTFAIGAYGPSLVVVPGRGGGRPYALSRTEISVANLDLFCRNTRSCPVSQKAQANGPARDVSLSLVQKYAQWLSDTSGYVYRLPTDEEWLHGARAGQRWDGAAAGKCADPAKGPWYTQQADLGRPGVSNPWGLVDLAGSVWEWVADGGAVKMRGGSYRSSGAECSVESQRAGKRSGQRDVGFRLLRELK
ncbi:bifunctional serine/threonine-protein kinase/formylglycine-generating enzyme family protein [Pseudoxanthomonas putridarboris]|uniref:Bifunctional serine/threonine-protein kinase/formylglycine-generating enzyme family protein n=1 Tax=Pseudoxanthomonas putridarboris TaxID=752605 RepID=A0ABU9J383_9GAMM